MDPERPDRNAAEAWRLVQDAIEREVTVPRRPRRIVSLVPSVTELVCDLGASDRLVGVSRYCTEPAEVVGSLARVGGPKDPDLMAIRALAPDLVLAVKEENLARDVDALAAAGVAVYVADVRHVEAAVGLIGEIGDLVDAEQARIAALGRAVRCGVDEARAIATRAGARSVFCPVWRDPWIVPAPDTYLYDLLWIAGGRPLLVDARETSDRRYPKVALEAIVRARPEVVLLPDEPYRFGADDAALVRSRLPHAEIHLCDGKLLEWYGRRTADVAQVARLIAGRSST